MRTNTMAVLALCIMSTACGAGPTAVGPPMAQVVSVIDGDTIEVRSASSVESVRLIGIDTPEVAHHGNPNECHGPEAAARLTELLPEGTLVRLERGPEARDIYGRLLAYIYGPDGDLINLQLAAEGHARPLSIAPNLGLADQVANAVADAKKAGIGLWAHCPGS